MFAPARRPGRQCRRRGGPFRQPALPGASRAFTLCSSPASRHIPKRGVCRRRRPWYRVLARRTVGRPVRSARGPRTALSYRDARFYTAAELEQLLADSSSGSSPAATTNRRDSPGTTSKPPMTVSKPAWLPLLSRRSTKRTSLRTITHSRVGIATTTPFAWAGCGFRPAGYPIAVERGRDRHRQTGRFFAASLAGARQ